MNGKLGVVVLAAGQGSRMKSVLPKVLHPVCGVPMVEHVIEAARALGPARLVVVVGHEAERVQAAVDAPDLQFVVQRERLGTGDAVRCCRDALESCGEVLVLNGDEPLVTTATLQRLLAARTGPMAFVSQRVADGGELGRVLRDSEGRVAAIVQAAEYSGPGGEAEVNWGEYAFDAAWLWDHIEKLTLSARGE